MSDQFAQMWKKAKEEFGGKKPSEKILFFIRKSSGVGKAAIGLDKALANIDVANLTPLTTAKTAFQTAKTSYMKTLDAATKEKGATDESKRKCKKLAETLSNMADIFEQSSVDCKTEALNVAILKLTTQGGVPEHDFVANDGMLLLSKKRDLKRDLKKINNETWRTGEISNIPRLREGFLEHKKQFEAIKTRVLPEIMKYCKSFGVATFKDLPCSPELKANGSHLSHLHNYYKAFKESDLPTHIAALELAELMMHERHIKEFDETKEKQIKKFDERKKELSTLLKNDTMNAALEKETSLTQLQANKVNGLTHVFGNRLLDNLEELQDFFKLLGADSELIAKYTAHIVKLQASPLRGGDYGASGRTVREKLSQFGLVINNAIHQLKKAEIPS